MNSSRVIIVGGGLAGMVIAHTLAKRNVPVVLLEADKRLGGKAGARPSQLDPKYLEDHGYHIVPRWYFNFRHLLHDISVDQTLIDFRKIHYLRCDEFPHFYELREPNYPKNFIHNVFQFGLVHWTTQFLHLYSSLDLAGHRFKYRAYLDRITVTGFVRSRWYRTEELADLQNQLILQASSIPSYLISAMTARQVLACYYKFGVPYHSVFPNDLQTMLIDPFHRELDRAGVDVRLEHMVNRLHVRGCRLVGLDITGSTKIETGDGDTYVFATPPDVLCKFVNGAVVEAEEAETQAVEDEKRLSDLVHLDLTPMASIHVYLKRKIEGLPREHVVLVNSRYELSFIDISQIWRKEDGAPVYDRTVLSGIASVYAPLQLLSRDEATKILVDELRKYLPITDEDIEYADVQPNLQRRLFLNTVGSWHYRPGTKTRLENVFVAGDYCRSQADLTTMEGCVQSAVATAGHVLRNLGGAEARPEIRPIPIPAPSRVWLRIMFWLTSPIAALVWGIAWLRSRSTSTPSEGVGDAPPRAGS